MRSEMTRAEERALEAYPYDYPERTGFRQGYEQAEKDLTSIAQFSSGPDGFFYGKGYEQAKKDFELTWEDILIIHEKIRAVYDIAIMAEMDSKQIYEEVLRRFKIAKKEKK